MRATATFTATEITVREGNREAVFPPAMAAAILALCGPLAFRRAGVVVRYPEPGALDKIMEVRK